MTRANYYIFIPNKRFGFLLLVLMLLSGCGTTPTLTTAPSEPYSEAPSTTVMDGKADYDEIHAMLLLYQQHELWKGTPYRLGGVSRNGIDCSAFVQVTFRDLFGIDLPRSTDQQFRTGRPISKSDLRSGDLVFFRNGNHVGIYLEDHKFLHASTSRGVMISSLHNSYWSRHYWRAVTVKR